MSIIISVITVAYNSQKTLQRTIDSVKSQSNDKIEYIVIDGKSSDNTVRILEENSSFITNWISEPDKGIYDAMNKGLRLSRGKYIIFMNSDDWFEESALPRVLPVLESSSASIVYGHTNIWLDGVFIGKKIADPISPGKIPLRMPFSHQSCFVLRSTMESLGGFSLDYKVVSDFDMIISILKCKKSEVLEINFPVSGFSVGGASSNIKMSARERLLIHLKHGLNPIIAYFLFGHWMLIALLKRMISPEAELHLRKIKTKYRL